MTALVRMVITLRDRLAALETRMTSVEDRLKRWKPAPRPLRRLFRQCVE
jgi:BMFP domain-containing protein YqiC